MKQKIRGYFYTVGGLSILLTAVFCSLVFYLLLQNQAQRDLKATAQVLKYSDSSAEAFRELSRNLDGFRLTIISPDGTVLLDTAADASAMESHKDRPEVAAAMESGQGEARRNSVTLSENTYYYAVKQPDGTILRLSKNTHSIWAVFASVIPGIVLVVAYMFCMCLVVASTLTRRIIAPIDQTVEQLDQTDPSPPYDELIPFARALRRKNDDIREQIERLKIQTQQINLITGNMNEGLILLDMDKSILSVNASAVRMLGARGDGYDGKNILHLSRNEQLLECVERAAQGENKSREIYLSGTYLQIFSSPVFSDNQNVGIMCLLLDISERKRAEKMRREFTANVSHELKTPLTSICGYAELLAVGGVKNADTQEFGGRIHKESMRLLDLITDIIKLSELDDTPGTPVLSDCELLTLAKDCVAALGPAALSQHVTLDVEGENCIVSADYAMLEQLVRNLVDNGIRYNKPGGSVIVSITKRQDGVALSVKDTGIGIAKEHQDRIFERFYRVDKSRSKATGGTGLGLAIVKHIAENHGARIELVSAENSGTEITVFFPV